MNAKPPQRRSLSSKESISQPKVFLLDGTPAQIAPLSHNFYKSQLQLATVIDNMFLKHTESKVLFVTLTFPDRLRSTREAHRRLNSLLNDIRERYGGYVWVLQPHKSGVIHYHLLLPVTFNTRGGTDLDPWSHRSLYSAAQRYNAMNPLLQAESDWWENKAPRFGFGRVEVAPIYSNGEAVRNYLSRQDWRAWHWPFEESKNVQFWNCSRNARCGTIKFSWNTPGGRALRAELQKWAAEQGCSTYEELRPKLGRYWGYRFYQHLIRLRAQTI